MQPSVADTEGAMALPVKMTPKEVKTKVTQEEAPLKDHSATTATVQDKSPGYGIGTRPRISYPFTSSSGFLKPISTLDRTSEPKWSEYHSQIRSNRGILHDSGRFSVTPLNMAEDSDPLHWTDRGDDWRPTGSVNPGLSDGLTGMLRALTASPSALPMPLVGPGLLREECSPPGQIPTKQG